MSKPSDEIHGVVHEYANRLVRIIDKIGNDEVESNERRERPSVRHHHFYILPQSQCILLTTI